MLLVIVRFIGDFLRIVDYYLFDMRLSNQLWRSSSSSGAGSADPQICYCCRNSSQGFIILFTMLMFSRGCNEFKMLHIPDPKMETWMEKVWS